jgi:predicted Fe-S protein YdhL (DUF1289 family)
MTSVTFQTLTTREIVNWAIISPTTKKKIIKSLN